MLPSASVFLPVLGNRAPQCNPLGLLSPEWLGCHSQMHTEKGNISPYAAQGILRSCYPLQALCPPFPLEHRQAHQAQDPGDGTDLQDFRLCPLLLRKNLQYLVPVLFPVDRFGYEFFLCNPLCADSFSLSHSFLCDQGILFFSPSNQLSIAPTLPQCGHFFKRSCAVLLSPFSDQFLGCSK